MKTLPTTSNTVFVGRTFRLSKFKMWLNKGKIKQGDLISDGNRKFKVIAEELTLDYARKLTISPTGLDTALILPDCF